MKKYWEINAGTIEESIKTAIKQIVKFAEKRTLRPIALTTWEERATELAVGITFEPGAGVNIAEWINKNRSKHV